MDPERLAHVQRLVKGDQDSREAPAGIGLFNVAQRIRLNYGQEYGLSVASEYEVGTEITVMLPAVKN